MFRLGRDQLSGWCLCIGKCQNTGFIQYVVEVSGVSHQTAMSICQRPSRNHKFALDSQITFEAAPFVESVDLREPAQS